MVDAVHVKPARFLSWGAAIAVPAATATKRVLTFILKEKERKNE
jgi:hypothetical protein